MTAIVISAAAPFNNPRSGTDFDLFLEGGFRGASSTVALKEIRAQAQEIASVSTRAWVDAIEAADGQQLEPGLYLALVIFGNYRIPLGGQCCIMAGARTLAGATLPMVGATPTLVNFVSADYNPILGLQGDGVGKAITTGVDNSSLSRNDAHLAVWKASPGIVTAKGAFIGTLAESGAVSFIDPIAVGPGARCRVNSTSGSVTIPNTFDGIGLFGATRSISSTLNIRHGGGETSIANASGTPVAGAINVFRGANAGEHNDARLALWSIGPNTSLLTLETQAAALVDAITRRAGR